MSNSGRSFFDDCLDFAHGLMAPACILCGARARNDGLCTGCRQDLPLLTAPVCPVCAAPGSSAETCGRCLSQPPAFSKVCAALRYGFPADTLVHKLKYGKDLSCARPLAAVLGDRLESEPPPDFVVPMPLSPARLAERGFNQSMEIARLVASEYGLRVDPGVCRRIRDSVPQALLPWKRRAANVRKAFACSADLEGKSVAVVDDVLTSGATLNELARILRRSGAREVVGWIVARTPRAD
jgi:ComF family protein